MNVFSEMFFSITGVKHYPGFLKNNKDKVVLYVAIVVLIYSAIANANIIPTTTNVVSKLKIVIQNFPDFHLKSGKLQMEESFYYDKDNVLIVMESENGSFIRKISVADWRKALNHYDSVFVMDESAMLLKNDGKIKIYDYADNFQISRAWVYDNIYYIYGIVAVYLVYFYTLSLMRYFLTALLVALVGKVICSFAEQKLTFWQLYLLSLYAKTLPLFIEGLLILINHDFIGFLIIAFAISCLYIGFAIHHMDMLEKANRRVDRPIIF